MLPLRPSRQEPNEEPIRAELFGIERLEQHAESLAIAQRVTGGSKHGHPLLSRVEANGRVLRDANRAIAGAIQEKRWITPAASVAWSDAIFFHVASSAVVFGGRPAFPRSSAHAAAICSRRSL